MEFINGALPALYGQAVDQIGQWLFYQTILDFIHRELSIFRGNLLHYQVLWVGSSVVAVMSLWVLWQGYLALQGKLRHPMELAVGGLQATFIVLLALTMTLGNADVYEFATQALPQKITQAMTGQPDKSAEAIIGESFQAMEASLAAIEALNVATDGSLALKLDQDRAAWSAWAGTAGPALIGGGMQINFKMILALFVGLGPLFILFLLFPKTQVLFDRWLMLGIGTMFAHGMMAFGTVLASKIIVSASAFTAVFYAAAAAGELPPVSVSTAAFMQGGVGLIATGLIMGAPTMAAIFFGATLGSFMPFSVFGGGAGRRSPPGASGQAGHPPIAGQGQPPSQDPAQTHAFRLSGQHTAPQADEIKPPGTHQGLADSDFLERYPNALVSNERIGGGDPLPAELVPVDTGTPPLAGHVYGASAEKLQHVLDFQAATAHKHGTGHLSDHDYAAARHAASRAFYSEFDQAAQAYADSLLNDRNLTMQEKYDGLSGLGAKAIAVGERHGIDYFPGATAQATAIGDAAIREHGLFDPRRPTRLFVDNPVDAGEPLRALLGVKAGDDIRPMMLNPDPGVIYSKGHGHLINSESWREHYDLVGQVVQQQDVVQLLSGMVAQRTFDGVDELMGRGESGDLYNDHVEKQAGWIVRNDAHLSRVEGLVSAAKFARETYINSQEDYLTIDVFASKQSPQDRRFVVRKFELRAFNNEFVNRELMSNESEISRIIEK